MTLLDRTALLLLALGLLGLAGNGDVPPPGSFEHTTGPRVAPDISAPPDTLHASAERNTPLILSLPSSLENRAVQRYTLLRGPALSGVAGRSFAWIPQGAETGPHEALVQAHHRNAPPDTLVLRIDLHS